MRITQKVVKTGNFYELYTFKNPIIFHPLKPLKHKNLKTLSEEISPEQKRQLQEKSTNRALGKIRRLILGNMYNHDERPKFITLTFDPKIHPYANNIDYVSYEFKKFRQRLSYSTDRHLDYVATPENHKNGNWHYHVLFFNMPFMPYQEFESEIWSNGYTNMQVVNRTLGTCKYITKYLSKAFGNPALRNRKRYYQALTYQPILFEEPQQVSDIISPLIGRDPNSISTRELYTPNNEELLQVITKHEYIVRESG